jgi:hypothetical protein
MGLQVMRLISGAPILAAVLALAGLSVAQAGVIYSTGFEPPTYTPGALPGQDGWQSFGPGTPNVITAPVKSGTQAAGVFGGFATQNGAYHTNLSGDQLIEVNADFQLASSSSQGAWQFATLGGPGLAPFIAGIDIDSTGVIHEITAGFPVVGDLTRDVWHNVDLKMNFGAKTYSLAIDSVLLGSNIPFCGDNGPCTTPFVGAYGNVFFDTFGGTQFNDSGYLDNVLVQTFTTGVPEPAAWAMMLAGFGGIGAAMRSRRKSAVATT